MCVGVIDLDRGYWVTLYENDERTSRHIQNQ